MCWRVVGSIARLPPLILHDIFRDISSFCTFAENLLCARPSLSLNKYG